MRIMADVVKRLVELSQKIKKMEIQAATPIAMQALEGLKPLVEKKGFGMEFEAACEMLIKTRPTGIALFNALQFLRNNKRIENIDRLLQYGKDAEAKIMDLGNKLIPQGSKVITHCHSTTALAILRFAKPKNIVVYVTETRPVLQGIVTAKELMKAGVPVVYCVDSAAGWLFENHKIDLCIVGADAVKPEGVINKIGTYLIAAIANDMDIPFYMATNTLKFDFYNRSVIEMRSPREIANPLEIYGAEILNPAFDLTPWKFITGLITEKGVLTRNEAIGMLKQGFNL